MSYTYANVSKILLDVEEIWESRKILEWSVWYWESLVIWLFLAFSGKWEQQFLLFEFLMWWSDVTGYVETTFNLEGSLAWLKLKEWDVGDRVWPQVLPLLQLTGQQIGHLSFNTQPLGMCTLISLLGTFLSHVLLKEFPP